MRAHRGSVQRHFIPCVVLPVPIFPAKQQRGILHGTRDKTLIVSIKNMKHGCIARALKIIAAVALVLVMVMLLQYKDYPPRRAHTARESVRAEFGSGYPTSNEFFIVFGFLQGCTCYYRFDTTQDAVQAYIRNRGLIPIKDEQAIRRFIHASPYWWKPDDCKTVEFFGFGSHNCTFSWDKSTGRCHIFLHGG